MCNRVVLLQVTDYLTATCCLLHTSLRVVRRVIPLAGAVASAFITCFIVATPADAYGTAVYISLSRVSSIAFQ